MKRVHVHYLLVVVGVAALLYGAGMLLLTHPKVVVGLILALVGLVGFVGVLCIVARRP